MRKCSDDPTLLHEMTGDCSTHIKKGGDPMKVIKNTLLFGIKVVAAVAAAIHVLRDKDVSK